MQDETKRPNINCGRCLDKGVWGFRSVNWIIVLDELLLHNFATIANFLLVLCILSPKSLDDEEFRVSKLLRANLCPLIIVVDIFEIC